MKARVLQFPETEDERHKTYVLKRLCRLTVLEFELMHACAKTPNGLRYDQVTPQQRKIIKRLQVFPNDNIVLNVATGCYELSSYGVHHLKYITPEYFATCIRPRDESRGWLAPVLPFPVSWSDCAKLKFYKINSTQFRLLQSCRYGVRRDQFSPKSNERRNLNWLKRNDYIELNRDTESFELTDTESFELTKWGAIALEADPMVVALRDSVEVRCRI